MSNSNDDLNPLAYTGCVLELPPDDSRLSMYRKQRDERGFDGTELWSLSSTIAEFIAPRLTAFRDEAGDYIHMSDETREETDLAIKAFSIAASDENFSEDHSDLVCWEEPGGGDSGGYMYYCIDGELSDYADVEKMISNTAKYPSLKPLMQDLCSNGIIPKGNYKVYFCWG